MEELLNEYGIDITTELYNLLQEDYKSILIPNKVEAKLKYFSKKDLESIALDDTLAKELILSIVKNLSNTYTLSHGTNCTNSQKEGYKALNSTILSSQVKYNSKTASPYKKIIDLLIKYDIIEKGRTYSVANRSNEYRLTSTYFGKGLTKYTLQSEFLKKKNIELVENNLRAVLKCPIAKAELINRQYIQFPTLEEVTNHLKTEVKKGLFNKKGKQIVFAGKNPARYEGKDVIFAEKYIQIFEYLSKSLTIPIVVSDRGGNRVVTAFNFMPSTLRNLCKFNGKSLKESDYSCLHPNIVQYIYGGSNTEMITHDKVSEYLQVDRSVAKLGHLSFFNLSWDIMYHSPLFKYYSENEPKMMENLFYAKKDNGYKETSQNCFIFETELMRENIKSLQDMGIKVLYVFDAIYCNEEDHDKVKEIMNKNAELYGILSKVN